MRIPIFSKFENWFCFFFFFPLFPTLPLRLQSIRANKQTKNPRAGSGQHDPPGGQQW